MAGSASAQMGHLYICGNNTYSFACHVGVKKHNEGCLRLKGDERPTMKEVAIELEGILASMIHKHPWVKSTSHEEENEYLLREPMDDYGYTDGSYTSSATSDSMSQHTILPIASGT
ncbi:hypothetical protein L1987_79146 [Smallanthus sonchifolius]|uniref:Uncharacterized protein n=1 Tax=Smallanthus sonchifolius TaxID=185202 RepID=A0ACB8ZEC9_9ASTR|nr:hypothetical protein L1987_79146 [Smallanthus sonchifolius]